MSNRAFNRERKIAKPLNWRRGMFRLWVLASSAWIMGWLIYLSIEMVSDTANLRPPAETAMILFGPPLALMVIGIATRWAFLGFKMDEPPESRAE